MACPNDEILFALIEGQLRGQALAEVDSHLDECALCREAVATLASGPRVKPSDDSAPAAIGRFLLLERIGEGAMGVVWSAYDPELDRKVALKLLHSDGDSARGRARLLREAQAMAQLSHPHVVTVYDVGAHADGVYVAMELIEGQSLRAWLAEERPREAILAVFAQAGAGLAAAHDAGLVHRDFKPENVLVDAQGRAKVGDFGLARAEEGERAALPEGALLTASLTRTGALLGTPAYMAPEQLAGEPAGARADQFAFSVALWEALEGQRPFSGASTLAELRDAIAKGPPPARAAGRRIEAALRRGLAPRAADRFDDLGALLGAITRRSRPAAWITGAAVLVLAAGGALYGLTPAPVCEASRTALASSWPREGVTQVAAPTLDRFARAWTAARVDACEATHVRHEQSAPRMDARMACLDRQRGALEAVVARLRDDDAALVAADLLATLPDPGACAATDVEAPPARAREAVAALRRRIDEGRVLVATADHASALALCDRLLPDASALGYGPALAEAQLLRSDALRGLARYEEARDAARESLLAAEAAGDGRAVVLAWLALVRTEGAAGRFSDAVLPLRHAEAALLRAGSPLDLREALLRLRGVVRTSLGELDRAEEDLRAALGSARERGGGLELAPIHTSLGELARLDARFDDALREHERALALDRESLGETHPRTGRDLHNVAGILRRLDRTGEARASYLEALAIATDALSAEHPDVALTQNSLGLLAFEAGDNGEARERWDAARAIFEANGHGDAALVHHNLALLELEEGRFEMAREHAARSIAIDEARLGPDSKRVGGEHVALGRALAGLGRVSEARAALERARAIATALGDPPLYGEAQRELDRLADPAPIARPRARPILRATPEVAPPPPPVVSEPPPAPPIVQMRTGSGAYGAGTAWE